MVNVRRSRHNTGIHLVRPGKEEGRVSPLSRQGSSCQALRAAVRSSDSPSVPREASHAPRMLVHPWLFVSCFFLHLLLQCCSCPSFSGPLLFSFYLGGSSLISAGSGDLSPWPQMHVSNPGCTLHLPVPQAPLMCTSASSSIPFQRLHPVSPPQLITLPATQTSHLATWSSPSVSLSFCLSSPRAHQLPHFPNLLNIFQISLFPPLLPDPDDCLKPNDHSSFLDRCNTPLETPPQSCSPQMCPRTDPQSELAGMLGLPRMDLGKSWGGGIRFFSLPLLPCSSWPWQTPKLGQQKETLEMGSKAERAETKPNKTQTGEACKRPLAWFYGKSGTCRRLPDTRPLPSPEGSSQKLRGAGCLGARVRGLRGLRGVGGERKKGRCRWEALLPRGWGRLTQRSEHRCQSTHACKVPAGSSDKEKPSECPEHLTLPGGNAQLGLEEDPDTALCPWCARQLTLGLVDNAPLLSIKGSPCCKGPSRPAHLSHTWPTSPLTSWNGLGCSRSVHILLCLWHPTPFSPPAGALPHTQHSPIPLSWLLPVHPHHWHWLSEYYTVGREATSGHHSVLDQNWLYCLLTVRPW